jgi:hypothetical protein
MIIRTQEQVRIEQQMTKKLKINQRQGVSNVSLSKSNSTFLALLIKTQALRLEKSRYF